MGVAAVLLSLWLCGSRSNESERKSDKCRQLIAIVVLIAILFPVISVSDDLFAVQNTSETDNFLRRDHLIPTDTHPVQPVTTTLPAILFAGLGVVFLRFVSPNILPVPKPSHPELAAIESRPPPAA